MKLISAMLVASLLITNFSHAITAEIAAEVAASSKAAARLSVQDRDAVILRLVDEISRIEIGIAEKTNEIAHDTRVRNVSIGISAAASLLIGYMFYSAGPGFKGGEQGIAQMDAMLNSGFLAAGVIVPSAGTAVVYNQFITIDREDLFLFQKRLTEAKENLLKHFNKN